MYVKFIAKENEWFDYNTEVFDGTINEYNKPRKRMLAKNYDIWKKAGNILGFGLRHGNWDMELCSLEEFEISFTKEQYEPSKNS